MKFWGIVGSVAAVASVIIGIMQLSPNGNPNEVIASSTGAPSPSMPPPPSCIPRVIPDASRVDARPMAAGVRFDEAKYKLTGLNVRNSEPQIEASGRLGGVTLPSGAILAVLSHAPLESSDEAGNPGDGRYYEVSSFEQQGECWSLGRGRACYAGCEGLVIEYHFVQVPAASFEEIRLAQNDGVVDTDLRRLGVKEIGQFRVKIE